MHSTGLAHSGKNGWVNAAGLLIGTPAESGSLTLFSDCLFELAELSATTAPQSLARQSLELLKRYLPFDAAWWGVASHGLGGIPKRVWLQSTIDLCDRFGEEWNAIAPFDAFGTTSIENLGQIVRTWKWPVATQPGPVVDFCQRHRLGSAMAITLELPRSGMLFFVSMYRSRALPFSDEEALFFGAFIRHLTLHWSNSLERVQPSAASMESSALADEQGQLIYLGRQIGVVLSSLYPDWRGWELPAPLSQALGEAPAFLPAGRWGRLAAEQRGSLYLLRLAAPTEERPLPPREQSVATLYAQGYSYKEVARRLDLSPATVRTYLRNAYAQLGVRNKIELITALESSEQVI